MLTIAKGGGSELKHVARKAIASAKYEHGNDYGLFELLRIYDEDGRYGVFRVDANGSLHDYEVRFEGMIDAVIRLFTIWAQENLPPSRIVVHDLPRQIGRSRKRCTLTKRSARR